jgi:anti-anti-sigma factor
VIIDAVIFGMIDLAELRRLYRVTRFDFWIAISAIVATLTTGVLAGVAIGIALSLGWLIYVTTRPPIPDLGREPGTHVFRDIADNPDDETFPGIAVIRLDGGLFFATSEALERRIRGLLDQSDSIHAIVLDLEGVNFVDSQGSSKLAELHRTAQAEDVDLRLARVKPRVRTVLEADGVLAQIGLDRIHGNVQRAVRAELANHGLDFASE